MIEFVDVCFGYDDHTIFNHVSLRIPNTGFIALYGQSGCGKTTLLKIILDQLSIQSGTMQRDIKKNQVVYIDQFATLDKNLSILSHYQLFCELYHSPYQQSSLKQHLKEVGLDYLDISSLIKNLSVGERKRLFIAYALCIDFQLLVIDEPTSSLEYDAKEQIYHILKEISCNKSVCITTHDQEFSHLFDDIYIIQNQSLSSLKNTYHDESKVSLEKKDFPFNLNHIFKIKSKIDIRNMILVIIVLLLVTHLTTFQQIVLSYQNQNTTQLTEKLGKNVIYTVSEFVSTDLLPSDTRYNSFYETGALYDLDTVKKISQLENVTTIKPYYQLNTTSYSTRYSDIDSQVSRVKIYNSQSQLINTIDLDANESSTPALVTYYQEENIAIDHKTIKGNYLDQTTADLFGLSENNFKEPLTITLEVGIPVCTLERNDTIRYCENNVCQDIEYDIIANDVLYDKKEVRLQIQGILQDNEYANLYEDSCNGLIYVQYEDIQKIIDEYKSINIRDSLNLWDDLNEKVIPYTPSHYAVLVDSIDHLTQVSQQIETIDNKVVTYTPNAYMNEIIQLREDSQKNNILLNSIYLIVGLYIVVLVIYNFYRYKKDKMLFFKNVGVNMKDNKKIIGLDIKIASIIIFILQIMISYIRMWFEGELALGNHSSILFCFIIVALVVCLIINIINELILRKMTHDLYQ